ncbi:hypothetical protein SAMN06295888_1702 [Desulfonatronum zhilinae]|nr:hypothetical protein SAMN06295888_1702 [Desulfonatronum zhilinae]
MRTIKTNTIRAYLKKKPGTVTMIKGWGFILGDGVALHMDLLETDLAVAFDLADEDMKRQVISSALKVDRHSIILHDSIPNAIATMDNPQNVVPCHPTPLLFQIGDNKAPTSLHVFKSESAPDASRKVLLIDQADLALLGFSDSVVNAPKNGSLPLIADTSPAPKRLACAFTQETLDALAQHMGSLLSLIPNQPGMGLAA